MVFILIIAILILGCIGLYFYNELEDAEQYIFDLESKPHELKEEISKLNSQLMEYKNLAYQAEQRATKHFEKLQEVYKAVFQEQNYDSIENLQNKLKTILDDSNSSNIK